MNTTNLTDIDRLRFAYELRAYVAADWMAKAINAALTGYRSRATTPEERQRIAYAALTEAKLHRAMHTRVQYGNPASSGASRTGAGLGDFYAMIDGMDGARPGSSSTEPLTDADWTNVALLAEALPMAETMCARQRARLDSYIERASDEERPLLTKAIRACQRDLMDEWGSPHEYADVMADSLRGVGRDGWWENFQHELIRAASRRAV